MTRFTHEDANKRKKWPLAAYGVWELANDGARTNGGGIVGDVTLTSVAAGFAKVYDEGTTAFADHGDSDDLSGWTNGDQLLSDNGVEEVNDAFYVGNAIPFSEIALEIETGTPATWGDDAGLWEYFNGSAWATLTIALDNTDTTAQDGLRPLQQDGAISFVPPSDWAETTIDSQAAYWIRWRLTALEMDTTPVSATGWEIIIPGDGFTCPHGGIITGIRVIDSIAEGSEHSGSTVKFIVMNFTTGDHSGELEWATAQRQDAFTGLTLAINQGDELAPLVTQEDSGNDDPVNVILELQVSG